MPDVVVISPRSPRHLKKGTGQRFSFSGMKHKTSASTTGDGARGLRSLLGPTGRIGAASRGAEEKGGSGFLRAAVKRGQVRRGERIPDRPRDGKRARGTTAGKTIARHEARRRPSATGRGSWKTGPYLLTSPPNRGAEHSFPRHYGRWRRLSARYRFFMYSGGPSSPTSL